MPLDPSYLEYPQRKYGMDHDQYDWSMLVSRKPVKWPEQADIALLVNVSLQYFPLNQQGQDLMMNAPSEVFEKQLKELHIRLAPPLKG